MLASSVGNLNIKHSPSPISSIINALCTTLNFLRENGNELQLLFPSVVVPHAHVGRRSPLSLLCCLSSTSRQQTWPGFSCIPEPALYRPGSSNGPDPYLRPIFLSLASFSGRQLGLILIRRLLLLKKQYLNPPQLILKEWFAIYCVSNLVEVC